MKDEITRDEIRSILEKLPNKDRDTLRRFFAKPSVTESDPLGIEETCRAALQIALDAKFAEGEDSILICVNKPTLMINESQTEQSIRYNLELTSAITVDISISDNSKEECSQ